MRMRTPVTFVRACVGVRNNVRVPFSVQWTVCTSCVWVCSCSNFPSLTFTMHRLSIKTTIQLFGFLAWFFSPLVSPSDDALFNFYFVFCQSQLILQCSLITRISASYPNVGMFGSNCRKPHDKPQKKTRKTMVLASAEAAVSSCSIPTGWDFHIKNKTKSSTKGSFFSWWTTCFSLLPSGCLERAMWSNVARCDLPEAAARVKYCALEAWSCS